MSLLSTTVVAYGCVDTSPRAWSEWLEWAIRVAESVALPATHVGPSGPSFRSGKIVALGSAAKRLRAAILRGDKFESISVYSLPAEFETAAFDYHFLAIRSERYQRASVSIAACACSVEQLLSLGHEIGAHVSLSRGEVFSLPRDEVPLSYIVGGKAVERFRDLRVIARF